MLFYPAYQFQVLFQQSIVDAIRIFDELSDKEEAEEIAKENAKAVTDGKDKVTSTTDGKDKVTSTTDGAKATELKWYERAYYWPVWSAFIVLGAGGLTWWYWDKISGKKPEGEGVEGE